MNITTRTMKPLFSGTPKNGQTLNSGQTWGRASALCLQLNSESSRLSAPNERVDSLIYSVYVDAI